MKRAFTLIELLVVIAIIAILAAILFPVFAQAKEAAKKTATLSQYKQVGTAAQIYLSDTDDTMPLAASFSTATQSWRMGSSVSDSVFNAVPAGWTNSRSRDVSPGRYDEESLFVLNSMLPYIKNNGMYQGQGLPTTDIGGNKSTIRPQDPALVNASYNGLLHSLSATSIAQPSRLTMFWGGHYKQNMKGFGLSQPQLDCPTGKTDCRFNPTTGPSGAAGGYGYIWWGFGNSGSVWLYGRTTPMVFADTHAKMHSFNGPLQPQYAQNVNDNPWSNFSDAKGTPYWMTDCVNPGGTKGTTYYPGFFRPDSEFSYTTKECDFGGG